MIDVFIVALLQVAAGDPQVSVPAPEAELQQQQLETEATTAQAPAENTENQSARDRVVCRTEPMTGSRIRAQRRCRTEAQSREAGHMWRDLVNRSGQQPRDF